MAGLLTFPVLMGGVVHRWPRTQVRYLAVTVTVTHAAAVAEQSQEQPGQPVPGQPVSAGPAGCIPRAGTGRVGELLIRLPALVGW